MTTWIGYEIGLIGDSLEKMPGLDGEPYLMFLNTIPYSFYPIMAIVFVYMVSFSGRDFGPMLKAERLAQEHGSEHSSPNKDATQEAEALQPVEGMPQRAFNAYIPVLVMVLGVLVGLYVTGSNALEGTTDPALKDIIGNADSYTALMWASLVSMMTAALLTLGQRIMNLDELVNAWFKGLNAMLMAMIILVLAWSLADTTAALGTADFLVSSAGDKLIPALIPAGTFILAALTAFATGSSWGVMAIMLPLVIPVTWAAVLQGGADPAAAMHLIFATVASVLCGAVWGDHCSPISDTTVLSSLASGCDHVEHVRTQIPYALLVGVVAVVVCLVPVGYGMPWWLGLFLSAALLVAFHRLIGKIPEAPSQQ